MVAEPQSEEKPVARRMVVLVLTVLLVGAVVVGAAALRPWEDVIDTEPAPPFAGTRVLDPEARADLSSAAASDREGADPLDAEVVGELGAGSFEGRAGHPAVGDVRVLELADGRRVVRIEGLEIPDGVLLKVYLSPSSADAPSDEFAQGVTSLGDLAYNVGDSTYDIPADTELGAFRSVSIWDERWGVNFAVAPITPPPS